MKKLFGRLNVEEDSTSPAWEAFSLFLVVAWLTRQPPPGEPSTETSSHRAFFNAFMKCLRDQRPLWDEEKTFGKAAASDLAASIGTFAACDKDLVKKLLRTWPHH